MPKPTGTRERIQQVARELFAQQGVQKTSLQEIANRLGITKPALYYHFPSREALVRSIVEPLLAEGEALVTRLETQDEVAPRALLEEYFDFHYRHRAELVLLLTEMTTLAELGLIETVLTWRERLARLLFGPDPSLPQAARAVIALGGLQDCTIHFAHLTSDELRPVAVDAACTALGICT